MRGPIGIALLSVALAAGAASTALAQAPGEAQGASADDSYIVLYHPRRAQPPMSPRLNEEVDIASLRLPTLGDLSKERWNDVHRRYPGRRGQPIWRR